MPETITRTPRRPRRIASTPGAAQPAPQTPVAVSRSILATGISPELAAYLQKMRDNVRMKTYKLLGTFTTCQILRPDGLHTVDFRKQGPVVATPNGADGQLLAIDPWPGIPPRWDNTDSFCPDCQATCDLCKGDGKIDCITTVSLPPELCKAPGCRVDTGQFNPKCETCGGSGLVNVTGVCPHCNGTGKTRCAPCRGTGKYPTMVVGGDHSRDDRKRPDCPSCKGSGRDHKEIPVAIEPLINARQGTMVFLGPITRFVIEPIGGDIPQVYLVREDHNRQGMVIALETEKPGCGAYFIGGVWK